MTFLLLPSTRLLFYQAVTQTLKVYPLKGEELITLEHPQHHKTILSCVKTITIYDTKQLAKATSLSEVKDVVSVSFNKKIQGLAHNNNDVVYASDKFGDIYSIGLKGQVKYLNSNLGIPTLLSYLTINNKSYIAVGDEDTRIKIYNEGRMHQIKSFWFLTRKFPLQLLQANQDSIILLIKKQQKPSMQSQQSEGFVQLHRLDTKHIEQSEYKGYSFYASPEIQQKLQCKYQYIVNNKDRLYLVKLFSNRIKIVAFNYSQQKYTEGQSQQISIKEGDWNYLNGQIDTQKGSLLIIYGKTTQVASLQTNQNIYQAKINEQANSSCSINENEHFICLNL